MTINWNNLLKSQAKNWFILQLDSEKVNPKEVDWTNQISLWNILLKWISLFPEISEYWRTEESGLSKNLKKISFHKVRILIEIITFFKHLNYPLYPFLKGLFLLDLLGYNIIQFLPAFHLKIMILINNTPYNMHYSLFIILHKTIFIILQTPWFHLQLLLISLETNQNKWELHKVLHFTIVIVQILPQILIFMVLVQLVKLFRLKLVYVQHVHRSVNSLTDQKLIFLFTIYISTKFCLR